VNFTGQWQQLTVMLDADGGRNGIGIDSSWGYQGALWIPTAVYGINWQTQKKDPP